MSDFEQAPVDPVVIESESASEPVLGVEVELSRAVSLMVNGVEHSFPAGANVVSQDVFETLKQTHAASAIVG